MVFKVVVQYLTPQQMAKWTITCKRLYKARAERLRVFAVKGVPKRYSANLVAFVNSLKGAHTIELGGRCIIVVVVGMKVQVYARDTAVGKSNMCIMDTDYKHMNKWFVIHISTIVTQGTGLVMKKSNI